MPVNKNALIRFLTLDKCFQSKWRICYIEDLVDACNKAIYDFSGIRGSVKKRQVYYDINFMESESGYSIPLLKIKDGRRTRYTYKDSNFSITNLPINEDDIQSLKETLYLLKRIKGIPNLKWIEETIVRLDENFLNDKNSHVIIDFEENPFLEGLHYFSQIFHAIKNKQVLEIIYKGFRMQEKRKYIIHPYYIKQYNTRWFLFGQNEEIDKLSNLALDRIISIKEIEYKYLENKFYNFEEFFDDIVGVTIHEDKPVEEVIIRVSKDLFPYILNKPLHGSQKPPMKVTDDYAIFKYELQVNYELERLLFSYADSLTVLEPAHLKIALKKKAERMIKNYL